MTSFIARLKSRLPQADWPAVVAALRSEPQVWTELQEADFAEQALDAAGAERDRWSPAFLGLLRLGQTQQFKSLRAAPMQPVPEKLRYQAAATLEKLVNEPTGGDDHPSPDLAQAALLALALRERRRLLNGWDQLTEDLSIAPPEFWRLPISCLLGQLPNPQELLTHLISATQSDQFHQLGVHALVTNPLPPDVQSAHLLELVREFPLPHFLSLLRTVAKINPQLAQHAAKHALGNLQEEDNAEGDQLTEIERLLIEAEIHQISGESNQADAMLRSALDAARQLEADLADKLAESSDLDAETIAHLQNSVGPRKASSKSKRPASLLAAAKVALKSENIEEAKEMALAALKSVSERPEAEENRKAEILSDLSALFLQLQLPDKALKAAEDAALTQPNDAEIALQLGALFQANGRPAEALGQAHLAAALAPNRSEVRRNLAHALAHNQQYEEAFHEWKAMLDNEVEPTVEDWLSFAESALHSNHFDEALKACQYALMLQPACGAAHALIGYALAAQGDEGSAMTHLRRATELVPAQTKAWLRLAELQLAGKEPEQALATLVAAQQFGPPTARMQQLIGDSYLALEQNQEALSAFTTAAKLANEQSDSGAAQSIALKTGLLQMQLGYRDSALSTLEAGHQSFPNNFHIAAQLGKLLLEVNEPKRALIALKQALQANPENIDLLMDIAHAQLAVNDLASDAEQTLEIILNGNNAPAEAKALMAEAKAKQGKHSEAIHLFDASLKSPLGKEKIWSKQLALGKARSQAALGKPVAAITTLETLEKEGSGDLEIQRQLCLCYQQAGRTEEAAQIAQKIYLGNAQDEDTVVWYADLMHSLGKGAQACQSLSKAALTENSSPKLILSLAKLQWSGDSAEAAQKTLSRLNEHNDGEAFAKAGRLLLDLGAAQKSIAYFKRALDLAPPDAGLLQNFIQAYLQDEKWSQALEIIDQAIRLSPHKIQLFEQKANVLLKLGRPQAALEAIEASLQVRPNDIQLMALKAKILREQSDWSSALGAASKAFDLDTSHPDNLHIAAELAVLCLQPDLARGFFRKASQTSTPSLELACLQAELALNEGFEIEAAKMLAGVTDESRPRLLAIQSQLASCRRDRNQAAQLLQQAIRAREPQAIDIFTTYGIAIAAEKLDDWQTAISLYEELANAFPGQILAQFSHGRALLLRAEWQQICEASQAKIKPESIVFSKEARHACKKAFAAAASAAADSATQSKITSWQIRAELRFGGKPDLTALAPTYPSTAAEAAALLHAARRTGELPAAEQRSQAFANTPEVLVEKAIAYLEEDVPAALEYIRQAAAVLLNSAPVQALAGRIGSQAGELVTSLPFIHRALALWPDQVNWQTVAGEIQQALGNLMEAKSHFSKAVQLEPDKGKHHFALGSVLISAHALDEGILSLQQATKLEPKNAAFSMALASAYRAAGDIKQAKSFAAQAQKLAPQDLAALHLQAELAMESGEPRNAKEIVQQALKISPKDSSALRLFAESLQSLGETGNAIAVLDRARETAEDEVPILIRRAQLQPDGRGMDALAKLGQRYSDRPEVFFALSEAFAATGEIAEAIQAAQQAIKVGNESLSPEQLANVHRQLGKLLRLSGNLDQSLHHLEQAAKLAPHSAGNHIERARVFVARRQHKQAVQAFRQAAALSPNDATPHFELALLWKEVKDYSAAEVELRKAANLAPKDRQIQRQLAAVIAMNFVHHPAEVKESAAFRTGDQTDLRVQELSK